MKNVNYASGKTPHDYVCSKCKATNCKLWRESAFGPSLFCSQCALETEKKTSFIDSKGYRIDKFGIKTDQIGYLLPAIPDEEGVGYWAYTSVPPEGLTWWRNLPTLPNTSSNESTTQKDSLPGCQGSTAESPKG